MSSLLADIAPHRRRLIAGWLLLVCVMVFAMVILGGVTRLTHSGLSMVEWKPFTGWWPPTTQAAWEDLFAKYRQYPEFNKMNPHMDVEGFKGIFWLEFIHRVWGRLIGLVFFLPAAFFIVKGWVNRRLAGHLAVMFVLGGLQGLLGWYMVKSGLVDRPDVSQYRLTAHFGAALVILGYMLWVALTLLAPDRHPVPAGGKAPPWTFARLLAALIFLTALSGGFVAGLDAGLTYNTFPLMDGDFVPAGWGDLNPWWLNPFENIAAVQFDHRLLAETVFVVVLVFWWRARQSALLPRVRVAVHALLAVMLAQVILGISTLLLVVPVPLAAAHQAGAVLLFGCALWVAHGLRPADSA